jgi:hypothetical protein
MTLRRALRRQNRDTLFLHNLVFIAPDFQRKALNL